jgi:hypothetical protein
MARIADEEIERLKAEVSLARLVESSGAVGRVVWGGAGEAGARSCRGLPVPC